MNGWKLGDVWELAMLRTWETFVLEGLFLIGDNETEIVWGKYFYKELY